MPTRGPNNGWRRLSHGCALLVGLVVLGCGQARQVDDADTVNFLIESMPVNLDPRIGTEAQSEHLDGLIFDSLVAHDAQMKIVPDLATTWETPDPLTYVFHLRRGVKFHDGRAFTSADVKFTFDSLLSGAIQSPKRGAFLDVKSVDAPDDATVVFHLREPYASFLWNLVRQGFGIVPAGSGAELARTSDRHGPVSLREHFGRMKKWCWSAIPTISVTRQKSVGCDFASCRRQLFALWNCARARRTSAA